MWISKICTYAPNFEMNRPPKWCSQPDDWHLAQSLSWFCDFGRKLENLGVPVYIQWCSATDGRTRQHRVMDDSMLPFTSLRENQTQTHLDFSYFRTTEPKLTPALRKMPLTDLRHTIGTGDLFHKQTSIWRTVYSYITCVTAADWGHHLRSLYKINAKQRRQILCSCKGSRILLRKTRRILCTQH